MSNVHEISQPDGSREQQFSVGTTDTLHEWVEKLRGRLHAMKQRVQEEIPGIRLAVSVYIDYRETDARDVTKLTAIICTVVNLCKFVNYVEKTEGGDAPECYEVLLGRYFRTEFSWKTGSHRVLVVIDYDSSQEPGNSCNEDMIAWRVEVKDLTREAVTSYGGKHLELEDDGSLFDTLMAINKKVRARDKSIKHASVESSAPLPMAEATVSNHEEKTSTKVIARLNTFKVSNLPLLKRENVPENNFNMRALNWSPWKLAMVGSEDLPKDSKDKWEKRVDRPGYRLKMLPTPKSSSSKDIHRSALFEVAVQGSGRNKKRYVVFSAFSSLCLGRDNWESRLLGVTKSQVDYVLKAGGRVHVRYWFVNNQSLSESPRKYINRYDYAWRKVRKMRLYSRDVVKGSTILSKSGL